MEQNGRKIFWVCSILVGAKITRFCAPRSRSTQMEHTQIFCEGNETVIWGDCLETMDGAIPDGSIDLVFADPPYNIGKVFGTFKDKWPSDKAYAEWCYTWLEMCIRKLSSRGSMYLMTSTQCMPYLDIYLRDRITILSRIVWTYDSSGVQAKSRYGSLYEPILFCAKDERNYTFNADDILVEAKTGATRKLIDYRKTIPTQYNTTKIPGNVWNIHRVRYRMDEYEAHPSQKPEALLERIIRASTNEGDTILDPFAGTFTTSAVAQRLRRRSIGIERELDYVKIGLRRLAIQTDLNGEVLQKPIKRCRRRATVSQNCAFEDL